MDWAEVKLPRRNYKPRPELTETMNEKVAVKLNQYIQETMRQPDSKKTKAQRQMEPHKREDRIEWMLHKSSLMVGVGPIPSDHIDRVEANLLAKAVLKKTENPRTRRQRTVKSLVKSWTMTNLQMTDTDWDQIQIEELILADNSDIIFIRCRTYEDAAAITANAKNIPNDKGPNSPRIVMHIDIRARKRHGHIKRGQNYQRSI